MITINNSEHEIFAKASHFRGQPFENVCLEIVNDHAWRGYEFLKPIFQLVQGKNLYLFLKKESKPFRGE